MLEPDHLRMRSVHLQPPEEWASQGNVLSFVFPKRGAGTFISATVTQPLVVGDALILEPAPKQAWPVGYAASFANMPDDFERPEPLPSSEHRDSRLEEL